MTDTGGTWQYTTTSQPAGTPAAGGPEIDRQLRRPEPRFTTTVAGAGMALVVAGVLVWGGDYLVSGEGDGGGNNRELGVLLSLATVAVGYVLAIKFRRGPLCTAGVVAAALGVPVLLGFLTWDPNRIASESDFLSGPINLNLVVVASIIVWVASYLAVPGARGHSFLIGLAAVVLWIYVLEKTEHILSVVPFLFFGFFFEDGPDLPDWTTVAIISLLFGGAYYAAAALLDRGGRHGLATPLVTAGFPATVLGIVSFADDGDALGVGSLLVVVGAVLCAWAATGPARRFTTWIWGFAIAVGAFVIIADSFDDNAAGGGATLIAAGVLLVLAAAVVRSRTDEPDDMTPGSSTYDLTPARQVAPAAAASTWTAPAPGTGYPPPADPAAEAGGWAPPPAP